MARRLNNLTIEGAEIRFRNFAGKEGKYNTAGKRNFCVLLDSDDAENLEKDGWNIKTLMPKDPMDPVQHYMQVAVQFNPFPPKVWMVTKKTKTLLDEESINVLDFAEIENVDLVIQPYEWEVNGKVGVKAYLKTMYVTIAEDEFADKYDDVPDSARDSGFRNTDEEEVPFR